MKRYIKSSISADGQFNFVVKFPKGQTRQMRGDVEDVESWDKYAHAVRSEMYLTVPSEDVKSKLQSVGVGSHIDVDPSLAD